jgi:bacillithiol synthase
MKTAVAEAAPSLLNLTVNVEPLRGSKLIRDYYDAAPALAPFFPGSPWDRDAWHRVAGDVREYFDEQRLQTMQGAIRVGTDAARSKLDRIASGEGFFVQTGQQAGLFGGPLYTVYKIISAIRIAQSAERELAVPVAPLFWVAADDHDFAEVDHTYLLTESHELHELKLAGNDGPQLSMQRHLLGQQVEELVDSLSTLLPETAFADELRAAIRKSYTAENSVAEAFKELIAFLFDRYDLLITSSADPLLKRMAAPLIEYELAHAEAHEDAVNGQTQKLVSLGYHEQVPVRSDAANVSYEDENGRDRLMRLGTDWELSRSKLRFSNNEIAQRLQHEPERFSMNVLLRPVVASAAFPTLAYVGGPAEVSYFAQIGCLFAAHGVPMPLVVPRAAVEVVEYKVQKVLDKFHLEPTDVRVPFDRLSTRVVRAELPREITDTLAQLREQLAAGYEQLRDGAIGVDPTLKAPAEVAAKRTDEILERLDKKIVQHLKRRNSVELEQLRRASANLFPRGEPQERVLGVLTYYARYGRDFLDAVLERVQFTFDLPAPEWTGVVCK